MKRTVAFAAIVAVALVVAAPAFAIVGVTGSASTDNTILRVQVGTTVVKIGSDFAESLNTSKLSATAKFITGYVGNTALPGAVTKTATGSSSSGSKNIGTGTKSIAGLASLKLTDGTISTNVAKSKVSSSVDFVIGSLNALKGFTNVGTTSSSTDSTVGTASSLVSRDVSIGKVDVLDLRTLLDQLGVDPLAMACGAISSVGTTLGVDTSAACATLGSVTSQITGGQGQIDAVGTVLGVLETALAVPCAAAPVGTCTPVTSQIDALQSTITTFQGNPASACDSLATAMTSVHNQLAMIVTTLNSLSGGALGTITALITPVTNALGNLDTATATLNSVCNTLMGIVNSVLDTPVLSLDLIKVSMDLAAKVNPTAAAAGHIGALKVGKVSVVNANDLVALGSKLNSAISTVQSKLATVFSATGLGLAAPSIDLLKVSTSKGKTNGSYFASAAMRVAHVGLGAATLELPGTLPLGALSGLGSFAPAAVRISAVSTPAVSVDVGVFSGDATFKTAGNTQPSTVGGGGGSHPKTGLADSSLVLAGMLTLIGAAFLHRVSRTN